MESSPEHDPKQASYKEKAAIEWNVNDLLAWIEDERPNLLEEGDRKELKTARISGRVFLKQAGNAEFFKKECKLPIGPSRELADLTEELAETTAIKSKLYLSCHAHHVDSKLTTSQETDSRPKMWRCSMPSMSRARSPCLSPGLRLRLWRQRSHWKPPATAGARQQPPLVSGSDPDRV